MRRKLNFVLAALLALVSNIIPAHATDYSTWKQPDLYVKRNLYVTGHILTGAAANGASKVTLPTIASGAGAGTAPTLVINGNDSGGQITLTLGTSPAANSIVATVTYGTTFKTNSFVTITPGNVQTATDVAKICVGSSSTSNFTLNVGAAALAGTTYIWNYQVEGN